MSEHAKQWAAVRQRLEAARACLSGAEPAAPSTSGVLVGSLEEVDEFLGHNELELAWDALAAVAERSNAAFACWHDLARAAALMGLEDKANRARGRATPPIPCDRALAIARQDAEARYKDLSTHRIAITLERDGWHIDYEPTDADAGEGSPHYVVDALTGGIVSGRYER